MRNIIRIAWVIVGFVGPAVAGAPDQPGYSLSVKLGKGYDPKITVCTKVRIDEPFEIVLTHGKTETVLSGKIQNAKKHAFLLELAVSQGNEEGAVFDRLGYELEPGKAVQRPVIVETRNHPSMAEQEVFLSHGRCPAGNHASE